MTRAHNYSHTHTWKHARACVFLCTRVRKNKNVGATLPHPSILALATRKKRAILNASLLG